MMKDEVVATWDRSSPWRQGHVLSSAAFREIFPFEQDADLAVIITHDCDLAQDPKVEDQVEILLGRKIDKLDGNCTHGKNSRRLHLDFDGGPEPVLIGILANQRRSIAKGLLAQHVPDIAISLSASGRSLLQRWLAARYRRSAFPDKFDHRLSETGVRERLIRILKKHGENIIAVFFNVDNGIESEHDGADDPYLLEITLLYQTASDLALSERSAQEAASAIQKLFEDRCFDKNKAQWRDIILDGCFVIADEAVSYAQSVLMQKWDADHISMREDPHQVMLS